MSFVGGDYIHDVFISYSHGTLNDGVPGPLKDWSDAFAEELRTRIHQIFLFRNVSVFFDSSERPAESVDRSRKLTGQIQKHVRGSAILVSLMTPHYSDSDWCGEERNWWIEEGETRTLDMDGRIIVCKVMPNVTEAGWSLTREHESWPECFKDENGHGHVGFSFYSQSGVTAGTVPYKWLGSSNGLDEFDAEMRMLVSSITNRLTEIKAELDQRARCTDPAGGGEREQISVRIAEPDFGEESIDVIYLHARKPQAAWWNSVRDTLIDKGRIIVPDELSLNEIGAREQKRPAGRNEEQVAERIEARNELLCECDAIVILGTEKNDLLRKDLLSIGLRAWRKACGFQRKVLPRALLSKIGEPVPLARNLKIPECNGRNAAWPRQLAEEFRRTAARDAEP
ncbi:MAG: toll/interleukin-1 receptor domain-containing protein [Pseudomonadota bacterium]